MEKEREEESGIKRHETSISTLHRFPCSMNRVFVLQSEATTIWQKWAKIRQNMMDSSGNVKNCVQFSNNIHAPMCLCTLCTTCIRKWTRDREKEKHSKIKQNILERMDMKKTNTLQCYAIPVGQTEMNSQPSSNTGQKRITQQQINDHHWANSSGW